jgi:DNA topoisomerase-1
LRDLAEGCYPASLSAMAQRPALVIVESPAKARTIAGFLGKDYVVESSIGHVRDLPRTGADVPTELKKRFGRPLGVDVEHDFEPLYLVSPEKKQQIQKLKGLLAGAGAVYLATDEDREGESIAWHLLEVLKPKVPVKRMVFHEITKAAIEKALANPRELDRSLVDAQETRRILDRLYGFEVSTVLWKKIMQGLSAGRVQSPATRLVVERELGRMRFKPAGYWGIDATFHEAGIVFGAAVTAVDGARLATGKDFDESAKLTKPGVLHLLEPLARELAAGLTGADVKIASVERKPTRRSPAAPFMTSTLQQESGRKLRFSAQRTMRAAQRLYEGGYITYMRTDSTVLSESAIASARSQIARLYGKDYLPDSPRQYTKKVKNAQEAHEAIRPAGEVFRTPEEVAREVQPDEAKLYELVWMRTVASQMKDSLGESVQVKMEAKETKQGRKVELSASGHTVTFPGFLRAYVEGSDDPSAEIESKERPLPKLDEGKVMRPQGVEPKGHETQPPSRFTEASLVQKLEELGVGRPSTYASILGTIVDRGYIWKKGTALVPTFKAFSVVNLLQKHFTNLVDYAFTAKMEDDLDAIAGGEEKSLPYLKRFYFGDASVDGPAQANGKTNGKPAEPGLRALVADHLDEIDARAINSLPLGSDDEGREIIVRVGKWGPYLQRGDSTAKVPEDLPPDELTVAKASALLDAPSDDRNLGNDPETGKPVYARAGQYGAYVQLGDLPPPAAKVKPKKGEKVPEVEKPKTKSLLKVQSPQTITLEEALELLSLPRVVGVHDGEPVTAQLGRYGAYVSRGKESRSLGAEGDVFTVTLPEALAVLAQPKMRQQRVAREPLKTFGEDPVSKELIKAFTGKFGTYVTDGTTNATLRNEDKLEHMTPERAQELLQMRREKEAAGGGAPAGRGGARGKGRGKPGKPAKAAKAPVEAAAPASAKTAAKKEAAPKEKAPVSKTVAKKAAAKPAAKKTAAKKK